MSELPAFLARAFAAIADVLVRKGVHVTGPPRWRSTGAAGDAVDVEAGFPVAAVAPGCDVRPSTVLGGKRRGPSTSDRTRRSGTPVTVQPTSDALAELGLNIEDNAAVLDRLLAVLDQREPPSRSSRPDITRRGLGIHSGRRGRCGMPG